MIGLYVPASQKKRSTLVSFASEWWETLTYPTYGSADGAM